MQKDVKEELHRGNSNVSNDRTHVQNSCLLVSSRSLHSKYSGFEAALSAAASATPASEPLHGLMAGFDHPIFAPVSQNEHIGKTSSLASKVYIPVSS